MQKNDNRINVKNNTYPLIEDNILLIYHTGKYFVQNQILFTHDNLNEIESAVLDAPTVDVSVLKLNEKFPIIDIHKKSMKINSTSIKEIKKFYGHISLDSIYSSAFHVAIILCYIIMNYILHVQNSKPEIIEITFGLTDQFVHTQQEIKDKNLGESQASKLIQDLPQLPKNSVPNMAPKPAEEIENLHSDKKNILSLDENKKIVPPESSEKQNKVQSKIGPKIDPNHKKIEIKDYLKRKEEDLRKVAKVRKDGVHVKEEKLKGQIQSVNTLPKSPFQSVDNIPDTPPGLAPTGEDKGLSLNNYNNYRVYLKNQLKLNWKLNEGVSFPKNLNTTIVFSINAYGYILGTPNIEHASGNKEFDGLALKALQNTFPVSTPPPKSIHPPQTFKATYSAGGVD